jgi:hypothetical protein
MASVTEQACETRHAWAVPSETSILCLGSTHHPDAAAVYLHDLLGDGEPEARAALGLGKRAVDLVELIEDPILLLKRYAGTGIGSNPAGDASKEFARSRMSAIAGARASAREVGSMPLGYRTNNGSSNIVRSRPRAWLAADWVK